MDPLTTIIISIIGSGAVFGFVQFLVSRSDKKNDQQGEILKQIKQIRDENAERWAVSARNNILRFEDELLSGEHHSREYFRSIMEEIDQYDVYCSGHEGFRNSFTAAASDHIKRTYDALIEAGKFTI